MRLEEITNKYRQAGKFLDFFRKQSLCSSSIDKTSVSIERYHWELACYYFGIVQLHLGSSEFICNIVKGRQVGMTTFNAAYAAWMAMQGKKILFIGNNTGLAKDFIKTTRNFIKNYNDGPIFQNLNCDEIFVGRYGEIKAIPQSSILNKKGNVFDVVIVDEFSFFPKAKDVLDTILSMGKQKVIASTLSGQKHEGHRVFKNMCIDFCWYHLPSTKVERLYSDTLWMQEMKECLTEDEYRREIEALFV